MPQISIIIPVYNTRPYLEKCLSSVLEQTFADWEALCINDGSTDGSELTLAEWAHRDGRFKTVSQKNGGLSAARNTGLRMACGKYVFFLDSDDFLSPNALETLYSSAEKESLDLTMCDFYEYESETGISSPRNRALELSFKPQLFCEKGAVCSEFADFAFALPFAWNKLYLREKINSLGLSFYPGAAEDFPFSSAYAVNCRRARFLTDKYLVHYRVNRKGSLSHQNARMLLDAIAQFAFLEENLKKYGVFEEVKETFWFNKMVLLIGDERLFAGRMGNVSRETLQKAYDLVRDDVNSLDLALFTNRNFFFRWKVRRFKKALQNNDLGFPRRLRKLRNLLMPVLDPWFKLTNKK